MSVASGEQTPQLHATMEGWVKRRRENLTFVWTPRYLKLYDKLLVILGDEKDTQPRRTIFLDGRCQVQKVQGVDYPAFKVTVPNKSNKKHKRTSSVYNKNRKVNRSQSALAKPSDSSSAASLDVDRSELHDHLSEISSRSRADQRTTRGDSYLAFQALDTHGTSTIEFALDVEEELEKWISSIKEAIEQELPMTKRLSYSEKDADIGVTPAAIQGLLKAERADTKTRTRTRSHTRSASDGGMFVIPGQNGSKLESGESQLGASFAKISEKNRMTVYEVMDGITVLREAEVEDDSDESYQRFFNRSAEQYNQAILGAVGVGLIVVIVLHWILDINILMAVFLGVAIGAYACHYLLYHIFVDKGDTREMQEFIPPLVASKTVIGSPRDVFRLIMDKDAWRLWDPSVSEVKVIEDKDEHTDILYVRQRPVWIWPLWQKPRDMVLIRYWLREENGTYIVLYQSTLHPDYPPNKRYVRANMGGSAFFLSPLKPEIYRQHKAAGVSSDTLSCLVTYHIRYDPSGLSTYFSKLGQKGTPFVKPMLKALLAISDEIQRINYVDPTLDFETPDSAQTEVGVDHRGLVVGVKTYPSTCPDEMWGEPHASKFKVRGPNYLEDRVKITASDSAFHCVALDLFSFEKPDERYGIGNHPYCMLNDRMTDAERKDPSKFTFIVNLVLPHSKNLCVVLYFQPSDSEWNKKDSKFNELLTDFIEGDVDFRNTRFKLIPSMVEGNFLIKNLVRSQPVIIGTKGLRIPYYNGKNWFEVDVDVNSDPHARRVTGQVLGVTKSMVLDLAFLIEAQAAAELPEQLIGAVRFQRVDLTAGRTVPALETIRKSPESSETDGEAAGDSDTAAEGDVSASGA
eukprot:Clim_evm113s134 gene=Clim_evmTU113s134